MRNPYISCALSFSHSFTLSLPLPLALTAVCAWRRRVPFESALRLVTSDSAVGNRKTGQSPPSVLTLGLVWASSRPPKEQLSHMLDLIDERLDLAKEP